MKEIRNITHISFYTGEPRHQSQFQQDISEPAVTWNLEINEPTIYKMSSEHNGLFV